MTLTLVRSAVAAPMRCSACKGACEDRHCTEECPWRMCDDCGAVNDGHGRHFWPDEVAEVSAA